MKMQGMGSGQGFWTLLSRDEQDTLSGLGMPRDYSPGATICLEGDPATHVYVLLAGWVKILSTTRDGHEIVLALRGDGDIVGETGGETTGRRNATIQAVGKVRALTVPYEKFSSFLDASQGADRAYRRVVTRKFNDADTLLRRRAVTTGAQRLAALLLDLAGRHGREVNGATYVVMPLSQEELASLIGASRSTVTRALHEWRSRHIIAAVHRHIEILDRTRLLRIADRTQ